MAIDKEIKKLEIEMRSMALKAAAKPQQRGMWTKKLRQAQKKWMKLKAQQKEKEEKKKKRGKKIKKLPGEPHKSNFAAIIIIIIVVAILVLFFLLGKI